MKKEKICHVSTVHPAFDIRIFNKECVSLARAGYDVNLIIPHEKKYEEVRGVQIHGLRKPSSRVERLFKTDFMALVKAIRLRADLYHFHDPELIIMGLILKLLNKKVIYDVHEDVPKQILNKRYIPSLLRPVVSLLFRIIEEGCSRHFDAIVAATPYIAERFEKFARNVVDINNYPMIDELYSEVPWEMRSPEVCYIGGISRIRGIVEIVKALEHVDTVLHLAGRFEDKELYREVSSLKGWKKVRYYGFISREGVKKILNRVKIGLVILHPAPNHINSRPNKMFEYMSAGIPVVASNFKSWKDVIEKNEVGLCVDPRDPLKIVEAINYLLEHDDVARKMGERARRLVLEKFNWETEKVKLLKLYDSLLKS